jgi:probable HAF family extracellular repeat protein
MFALDRSWKRSPLARTFTLLAAIPALSLLFAFVAPAARAEALYTLHDLGTLPGETFSVPWAINASGQIVGWSGVSPPRAFIYTQASGMVALPGLPGQTYTLARGINDAGVVVGGGWAPGGAEQALRWTAGVPEALGILDGSSESWAINESGVSIGSSPTPGGALTTHAFMHTDDGGMIDIAPNGNATAYDVNDRGDVTGTYNNGAFLWSPRTGFQFLGSLPDFTYGNGRAVNNAGQVAGFSINGYGNASRVWRYTPGVGMVSLGGVGENNVVWGMNSQGDFVGQGQPTSGLKRAFVYTDAGGLRALNDIIDASPRWFLLAATDINDAGQIVAYGLDNVSGLQKAVRLDPIPRAGVGGKLAPHVLALAPVTPNPSRGEPRFALTLGRTQRVSIGVYDVAGHVVAILHDGPLDPGTHSFQWLQHDLRSGLYFVQARGEAGSVSQRFTIVR